MQRTSAPFRAARAPASRTAEGAGPALHTLATRPDLLRRAARLGHHFPAVSRAPGPVLRRVRFWDRLGTTYDPETFSAGGLRFKLQGWQYEQQLPLAQRRSGLSDPEIAERIRELTVQIAVTNANQDVPRKARLGDEFERKHVVFGERVDARTLKDSIDRSIEYDRARNTVLHLNTAERDQIQAAAMVAIRSNGFATDRLHFFQVSVGTATQYSELQGQQGGGNFSVFTNAGLVLGARWHQGSRTGEITHLETLYTWGGRLGYDYTQGQGGQEQLAPVPNDGRPVIDL